MDLRHYTGGRNSRATEPTGFYETPGSVAAPVRPTPPSIELRSADVNEVLSKPPVWLIRWGITVFAGLLIVLGAVTYFIEYPDLVRGNLKVVATQWPKSVSARTEGRLVRLLVREGQPVRAGQQLAFLESTANPDQVMALDSVVDSWINPSAAADRPGPSPTGRGERSMINGAALPSFFQLGELQRAYQTFQETYVKANALTAGGLYSQKRRMLQNDVSQLQALSQNNQAQTSLYENDLSLAEAELRSQERLMKQGFVSRQDYRQALSRYLSKQQTIEQARSGLNTNQMSQNQKRQELLELTRTIAEQKNNTLQTLNTLKSELEAWKQRFVATAPTTGRVSFVVPLQEGEALEAGQELLYVLPNGSGYFGEMNIGQYNFGKVRRGQRVLVRFASYPYQEFGLVTGRVATIADMPRDTAWRVTVQFPQGLQTSAHKRLPFRNGMGATAEIVTEDISLFERFFYELRRLIR